MIHLMVGEDWHGKRLDRFLFAQCAQYPGSVLYKAFRKRDVRVNNKRSQADTLLASGDMVTAYLPDVDPTASKKARPNVEAIPLILHEDEQLLIVDKPQGVAVQPTQRDPVPTRRQDFHTDGTAGDVPTTVVTGDPPFDLLLRQWWAKNRDPLAVGFPALCHRLDRNTGGLLMLAKTEAARQAVSAALRAHQIRKKYRCFVAGVPSPSSAVVDAWLEKDASAGRVYIHEAPRENAVPIRTRYRVLEHHQEVSLLEVEIITGRTHQIRAQLARLGYPILGDSRYGSNAVNRRHGVTKQLLWACELVFSDSLVTELPGIAGSTISCDIPEESLPSALRLAFGGHMARHMANPE